MARGELNYLSRRERQIMDVIYKLGTATAAEVRERIPAPPSMNAVRRLISILEEKELLRHRWSGPRHIYSPVISKQEACGAAIEHLKTTFFAGSAASAMAGLLDHSGTELSDDELQTLAELIKQVQRGVAASSHSTMISRSGKN